MKKNELLALLNEIEDDAEIDEIILGNGFAKPITDVDGLNSLLSGNKELQGLFDKKVTAGIETFKKGGMQKLIEAEVLKRTGGNETPQEKKIRELEERFNKAERERAKAEMVAKYKDVFYEKKIPSTMLDFLLGEDEETTGANIELFENSMKQYIEAEVKNKLGASEYKPPVESGQGGITKEQFRKMSYKEKLELYNNDLETYNKLKE